MKRHIAYYISRAKSEARYHRNMAKIKIKLHYNLFRVTLSGWLVKAAFRTSPEVQVQYRFSMRKQ